MNYINNEISTRGAKPTTVEKTHVVLLAPKLLDIVKHKVNTYLPKLNEQYNQAD
jgi:hypothetical protein